MIIYNLILILGMVLDFALVIGFVFPTNISEFISEIKDDNDPKKWRELIIEFTYQVSPVISGFDIIILIVGFLVFLMKIV